MEKCSELKYTPIEIDFSKLIENIDKYEPKFDIYIPTIKIYKPILKIDGKTFQISISEHQLLLSSFSSFELVNAEFKSNLDFFTKNSKELMKSVPAGLASIIMSYLDEKDIINFLDSSKSFRDAIDGVFLYSFSLKESSLHRNETIEISTKKESGHRRLDDLARKEIFHDDFHHFYKTDLIEKKHISEMQDLLGISPYYDQPKSLSDPDDYF